MSRGRASSRRRGPAGWAATESRADPDGVCVEVLIPTANRPAELAVTLSALAADRGDTSFAIIIADQSDDPAVDRPAVAAMLQLLRAQGRRVEIIRNLPRRGIAHQRHVLFTAARADRVVFLDDDVWLEPGSIDRLSRSLTHWGCGFVGFAVQGLSFLDDRRPEETAVFDPWESPPVRAERVRSWGHGGERWTLHNAANLSHLAADRGAADDEMTAYRVGWVGGCVLFDRRLLEAAGGFEFWRDLPRDHVGEDRVAQWRVMELAGGAGILPSGAVHLEAPTTIVDRRVEASDIVFAHELRAENRAEEPKNDGRRK